MKIVVSIPCLEKYKNRFEEACKNKAEVVFVDAEKLNKDIIRGADAIIADAPVDMIKDLRGLKWLQVTNAGVDIYTSNPEFPKSVTLTNVSGAFGSIMAEYVLAGILSFCKRLYFYKDNQRKCKWLDAGSELQLMGKTALILGAGDIGSQIAKRLKAFDVNVLGIKKRIENKPQYFDEIHPVTALGDLLKEADFIIGCMPKTPETFHLMDEKMFSCTKENAFFVNVGRGALADTDALVKALNEGKISGAILDVFEEEPLPPNHPLWNMEQVLITPHIAGMSFGHSEDVEEIIVSIALENLDRFLSDRHLINVVNFDSGYADGERLK